MSTPNTHKELRKVIREKLKSGRSFVLGCSVTSIDYWKHILQLHFPDAKIEDHEEGLRLS